MIAVEYGLKLQRREDALRQQVCLQTRQILGFQKLHDPVAEWLGLRGPIDAAFLIGNGNQRIETVATRGRHRRIRCGRPVQVERKILGQPLGIKDVVQQFFIALTEDDGVVAAAYAPCEVRTAVRDMQVHVVEETNYPFRGAVHMTINPASPVAFPLLLRIPAWAAEATIKVNGQRAYKLARAGKEVKMEPRKITIKRLELINYKFPLVQFITDASSGTYIRSLVEDIGATLKIGAYTTELKRTKIGEFDLKKAVILIGPSEVVFDNTIIN